MTIQVIHPAPKKPPVAPATGSGRVRDRRCRRYCLITPCRDEAQFARRTLDSVLNQTEPPALWVIVDDASKDQTPQILAEYAAKYPFIKIIRRADRGFRKLGGGVIDAFYDGYQSIDPDAFDYVCKLDLDLDLPPRYFERLMDGMEIDPRIGTASGKPWYRNAHGRPVAEACGDENSVGMAKFYRVECFRQIGGFVRELMWDGIDGHRCRMHGWIAASWGDPDLRFEHLRPMGTSDRSWWRGRMRHGRGQYFMGTGPLYMLASAIYRMTQPPLIIGGLAILCGYLKAMLGGHPRYEDPAFRSFLRRFHWRALLLGKRRATERLDEQQAPAWRAAQQEPASHSSGAAVA